MKDATRWLSYSLGLADYHCRQIIYLNEQLEALEVRMANVSAPRFDRLPGMYGRKTSLIPFIDKKDDLCAQIRYHVSALADCRPVERLELTDQRILWDLYLLHDLSVEQAADKYGYSVSGMYKHLDAICERVEEFHHNHVL